MPDFRISVLISNAERPDFRFIGKYVETISKCF